MTRTTSRLALAVIVSLLLHFFPFIGDLIHMQPPPASPPPLRAEIRMPARPAPPPPLMLDKPKSKAAPKPTKTHQPKTSSSKYSIPAWQQEIERQFRKQQAEGVFYPAEAIARRLEGEVLVFMLINEHGQVTAARVEQGCGQRLLDDAALKAVRALHSLPADAPSEAVISVRFSLH